MKNTFLLSIIAITLIFSTNELNAKRSGPVYDIEGLTKYAPLIVVGSIRKVESKNGKDFVTIFTAPNSVIKGVFTGKEMLIIGTELKEKQPIRKPNPPQDILVGQSFIFFLTGKKTKEGGYVLMSELDGVIGFSWPVRREIEKQLKKK